MSEAKNQTTEDVLVVDYIVEQLCAIGINTFFALTGGAIAPLIDAIARNPSAHLYCVQHEQAASMAVDGYYRVTGRPACAVVTSGPGVQNVLNGLCGCFYDSMPALFISGQVNLSESLDAIEATPRQVGFQEMPVVESYRPFLKYGKKVMNTEEMKCVLSEAVTKMMEGRKGPSLLDLPVNVQMSCMPPRTGRLPLDVDTKTWKPFAFVSQTTTTTTTTTTTNNNNNNNNNNNKEEEDVQMKIVKVAEMLRTAERPLFLLGDGARGARDELADLLKCLQVPFIRSWGGLDLLPSSSASSSSSSSSSSSTDPRLDVGVIGVYGDRVANFALQNADLLLVIGARLDTRQTGGNLRAFSTQSRKVMVDIDPSEFNKLGQRGVPVEMGLALDALSFCRQLSTEVKATATTAKGLPIEGWRDKLGQWQAKFGVESRPSFDGFVSPYELLARLNTMLPDNAIVVSDTGATVVWVHQVMRTRTRAQRMFSNLGNSSMGYALCSAMGAAVAEPDRPVYCIIGDGGFQQNIQELVTARHYGLNIKVIVMNNSGYGIIKQFQNSYLGGRHVATSAEDLYGVRVDAHHRGVDFVKVAQAYGVQAQRVEAVEELTEEMVRSVGLALYEVNVHEQHGLQPKTEFGNSIENMSPFIDSAEDMVVPPPPQRKISGWVKM